jgi:hypothetical protein
VRRSGLAAVTALLATLLAAGAGPGLALEEKPDGSPPAASLGMTVRMEGVVVPGPELVAAPLDRDRPLVVRITATYAHGSHFRYDFEVYGLEAGRYDLRDYLLRADGSPLDRSTLPPLAFEVVDILPPGQVKPRELAPGQLPSVGGYQTLLWVGGAVWVIGLVALLTLRRRRSVERGAHDEPGATADRLRPLVEQALAGELSPNAQARLEALLLDHWRRALELDGLPAAQAMARLREHEHAGALLRALEGWLYEPPGRAAPVDLPALLAPYRKGAEAP